MSDRMDRPATHPDRPIRAATVDALVVAASPLVLWILVGAILAAVPGIVPGLAERSGGYADRLLSYVVLTIIGGAFNGLALAFAALTLVLFAIAYVVRYRALARGADGSAAAFRWATRDEADTLADASPTRRTLALLVDAVMLLGGPPWWLLLPGPVLLVAELFLLVVPVFAIGLVPWVLGSLATRAGGARVASVGQVLTGLRAAEADGGRRLVLARDLPPALRTPSSRYAAAWTAFVLSGAVAVAAVGGVIWVVGAVTRTQ